MNILFALKRNPSGADRQFPKLNNQLDFAALIISVYSSSRALLIVVVLDMFYHGSSEPN